MANSPEYPSLRSPLDDPLANWPNDDLLITCESRAKMRRIRPALLRVLDWPELREAFIRHDAPAGRGKRNSNYEGLLAVMMAGLGIIALGLSPLFSRETEGIVATAALCLMGIGGLLGILHWLLLRAK